VCPLCKNSPETAEHICLHWPFTMQFWQRVATWTDGLVEPPITKLGIEDRWRSSLGALPIQLRRVKAAVLIYTLWNVWKKGNRRTFEAKEVSPLQVYRFFFFFLSSMQVYRFIHEEMDLRKQACEKPRVH
jgi:hypothetical protein